MRPATVILFPNGMVAVCDRAGVQMEEMQGRFSQVAGKILEAATEETVFYGWPDIKEGGKLGEWK